MTQQLKQLKKLSNATDNLIEQQFYRTGSDEIIGRTPEVSVKISFSGQIIKKFKDLFNENLEIFLKGNYLEFIYPFLKIKGINKKSLQEIYDDLRAKIQSLQNSDIELNIVVLYTIVLSSLISFIRDIHFEYEIEDIIERIQKKYKLDDNAKDVIHDQLNFLFMRNNKNISILYNLSYLDALAESFNYKKVAHVCKIQKSKYINKIVKIIARSLNL
ncbi:MAG: hypothetical protein GF317_18185 [Candidatus Lokiarchaeota archaeon]|nr:hypothetical protein [Candidatus Lokiarchaeota archaeon]MBD3201443.1 hypothetical protein [Candidatus Lokiarchaeota archaeon]